MRKVKRMYEEINEQNVEELYEFMSEEDMKNAKPPFSENLAEIMQDNFLKQAAIFILVLSYRITSLPYPFKTCSCLRRGRRSLQSSLFAKIDLGTPGQQL